MADIQTPEQAKPAHNDLIANAVPNWDLKKIEYLHGWADGVRTGWYQSGLIDEELFLATREELKLAVARRKKIGLKWWDIASRLGI